MASLLLLLLFLLLPLLQTDVLSHHLQRNLIYLDSQVRTSEFTPLFLRLLPRYFYEALELLIPHFSLGVTSVSSFINATLWSCLLFLSLFFLHLLFFPSACCLRVRSSEQTDINIIKIINCISSNYPLTLTQQVKLFGWWPPSSRTKMLSVLTFLV